MKRFTATEKWTDKWFRKLAPLAKNGYQYLLDCCDGAGVIELDTEAAEFQIGGPVDWDGLIEGSEGRLVRLANGRIWLTKFIEFQYGKLSPDCAPHRSVLNLLEKHSLSERVLKGYQRGSETPKDKDKDKEKDKDKDLNLEKKEVCTAIVAPPDFDTPELTEAVCDWLAYKAERKERYKPAGMKALFSHVRNLSREHGPPAIVQAIRRAMSSGWKGFDHGIGQSNVRGSPHDDPYNVRGAAAKFLAKKGDDG
jgi:hypothetical protein